MMFMEAYTGMNWFMQRFAYRKQNDIAIIMFNIIICYCFNQEEYL